MFYNLPLRTLVYLLFDLNSGIGLQKRDGTVRKVESDVIGPHNLAVENRIGSLFRAFLEKCKMFLPLTLKKFDLTFYSTANGGVSHIDHIAIPQAVWHEKSLEHNDSVWIRSGRKLQLIKSVHLADHVPFSISHKRVVYPVLAHHIKPKVDRDALMKCLLYG